MLKNYIRILFFLSIFPSAVLGSASTVEQYLACSNKIKEKMGEQKFESSQDIQFITAKRDGNPGVYYITSKGLKFYPFPKKLPQEKIIIKIKMEGKRNSYLIFEKGKTSETYHMNTTDTKSVEDYVLKIHKEPMQIIDLKINPNSFDLLDDQAREGLVQSEILQMVDGVSDRYKTMKKMSLGNPDEYARWALEMLESCKGLGGDDFQEIVKSEMNKMHLALSPNDLKNRKSTGAVQQ